MRPVCKKRDHLWLRNWRPICCVITESKLAWMVVLRRIQQTLYEAGDVSDNIWGSVPARSTQEGGFLYDMYLHDEDLERFMASVDVKAAFLVHAAQTHRGVVEAAGLYGDFKGEYLRNRRYTIATEKGYTEWVNPGSRVPQGGVEAPFLYMLTMLPLMRLIAQQYPHLARGPHSSLAQAYLDDAVPMARDKRAQ